MMLPLAEAALAEGRETEAFFDNWAEEQEAHKQQMKDAENRLRLMVAKLQDDNRQLREENERLRISNNVSRRTDALGMEELGQTYEQTRFIRTHDMEVHAVSISLDGILAAASWDTTVSLYDLSQDDEGACVKVLGAREGGAVMGGLYDVAFACTNPDILGCASADHNVYLWKHYAQSSPDQPADLVRTCSQHTGEVNSVRFHPRQPVMVSCSDDSTAIVWDFQVGIPLRCLDDHGKPVYGACFLDPLAEYQLATCCFDRQIRIFDLRTARIVETLVEHSDDIVGIDFAPLTSTLASGSDDGTICVWDVRKLPELLFRIDTRLDPGIPENEVKRVSLGPTGQKIAGGCSSGQAVVYDISGSVPVCAGALGGHTDCVFDVCWGVSDDGREYLVDASHDMSLFVWRPTLN